MPFSHLTLSRPLLLLPPIPPSNGVFSNESTLKMGTIKNRNGVGMTEAEDIKRWQEYTYLYKNDLHDPDNHDGAITHRELDFLDCKVKWAFSSV